jgi:hypothetical protein
MLAGKFWNLRDGAVQVLYRKDFDRAAELAIKEVKKNGSYAIRVVVLIPASLKGTLYMQD